MKKIALGLGITCLFCLPNLLVVSCSKNNESNKKPSDEIYEDTKITPIVNTNNLKYNDEKIDDMTKIEFLAKIQNNLSKFVLYNIKQFIIGDISRIKNLNDFSTEIKSNENNDNNTFNFILTIHRNRWYKDNKIQTNDLHQKVQIINFKNLPSKLDPAGGQLIDKKLYASKYKNVINLFNLKSTTSLIKLNDNYFNSILQSLSDFKNLKVKILNGDTKRGEINIDLVGTFKNEMINTNITISGFNTFTKNENILINDLNLNKNAWIENLKPIIDSTNIELINSISSEEWINTFVSNFVIFNEKYNELGSINDLIQKGFNFIIKATINKNNKQIHFKINATYTNSEYIDGNWKEKGELISWIQVSNNDPFVLLPTIDDVKSFLISKVTINESIVQSYYPSYFLGKSYMNKKLGYNYFSIDDLFKNEWTKIINKNYLKENIDGIAFGISCDSVNADDFSNKLEFVVTLAIDGEYKQIFNKHFDLSNKTKNINENEIIANNKINNVAINSDLKINSFLKRIISILKKNYSDLVNEAFNLLLPQHKLSISNISNTIIPDVLKQSLIGFDDTLEHNDKKWNEQIKKFLTPSIFNKEINLSFETGNEENIEGKLNYFSRLYENSFVIESIIYKFEDILQIDLINIHQNAIMIKIDFVTEISFNKKIEQYKSQLSTILLKSQWENQ